jgi:hypothetical protein
MVQSFLYSRYIYVALNPQPLPPRWNPYLVRPIFAR